MAKTATKQRQSAQQRAEQARLEWDRRVLKAARASVPAAERGMRAKLVLAAFLLGFAAMVLAGLFFAPGNVTQGGEVGVGLALITGLTAGGLSCLAVQGGLLATAIAQREEQDLEEVEGQTVASHGRAVKANPGARGARQDEFAQAVERQRQILLRQASLHHSAKPVVYFLLAKLFVYTLLGFGLGWLGSQLKLSPDAQAVVQVATALFMIATALHLLKVHPIFRYVIIQPPRFITRRIRNRAKSKDIFAPAILGAMTVFMPCAVTQVMQLAAINSGSPLAGAGIMFAFVLGTAPLFFGLGVMATKLGDALRQRFLKVAAIAVLAMALFTMESGLRLMGSPVSFSKAVGAVVSGSQPVAATVSADAVQEVRVRVESRGYSPSNVSINAGKPARIVFEGTGSQGCASALVWEGQVHSLPLTGEKTFPIEAREKGQDIEYSCAMGMYGGTIKVV